jgi:hypothetical protein
VKEDAIGVGIADPRLACLLSPATGCSFLSRRNQQLIEVVTVSQETLNEALFHHVLIKLKIEDSPNASVKPILLRMAQTTLARKLSLAPHLSLLQRKARCLGLMEPENWVALAVQRGCYHYSNPEKTAKLISRTEFSDEELSALLLSVANPYNPLLIRVAAQLLSAPGTDIRLLARLCQLENALCPLAWIAQAAAATEPGNETWTELCREIDKLTRRKITFPEAVLPHPSRFRIETGFQRFSINKTIERRWLRPIPKSSSEN